jgi:hypothetical protein
LQLANSKSLDWTCLGHVVRVEKEAAGDIRLNMKLFRACVNDQKKFCKGVEPGHMRVQVRQRCSSSVQPAWGVQGEFGSAARAAMSGSKATGSGSSTAGVTFFFGRCR